jgi:hypothetical protein
MAPEDIVVTALQIMAVVAAFGAIGAVANAFGERCKRPSGRPPAAVGGDVRPTAAGAGGETSDPDDGSLLSSPDLSTGMILFAPLKGDERASLGISWRGALSATSVMGLNLDLSAVGAQSLAVSFQSDRAEERETLSHQSWKAMLTQIREKFAAYRGAETTFSMRAETLTGDELVYVWGSVEAFGATEAFGGPKLIDALRRFVALTSRGGLSDGQIAEAFRRAKALADDVVQSSAVR